MDTVFFRKLYDIFQIPFYWWNEAGHFQVPEEAGNASPFSSDPELRKVLQEIADRSGEPVILFEDSEIYYGVLKLNGFYAVLGPVSRHKLLPDHLASYRHQHAWIGQGEIRAEKADTVAKILSLLYYQFSGNDIDPSSINYVTHNEKIDRWETESESEDYQLENSEMERNHNSVDYENQLCRIVREGDVAGMKKILGDASFDTEHSAGQVAVKQNKRMEYWIVSLITILSRTAVDGGMNQEAAYALSDVYMRKLEQCTSVNEMMMLGGKAQLEYTERVHEARERRNHSSYIEECKDYIAQNLRKPFKVGDIAPAIGVNRSYLARIFSEAEGVTIQQYVMQERCRHAANLLKYSKYPISLISEYFCFSSQSHFGRQFKQYYGMTPNEYRRQNQVIHNYEESS